MFRLFLSVDISAIGRMHSSNLTDQQCMELFFTPKDEEIVRQQLSPNPDDCCSWTGVHCEDQIVTDIYWHDDAVQLEGQLNFLMLPRLLETLDLKRQRLYGEVELRALPLHMERVVIEECLVSGTIDLGSLPPSLERIRIVQNRVTSVANIQNLPLGLIEVRINEPKVVETTIAVGKLPVGGLEVDLQGCGICYAAMEREVDRCRVHVKKHQRSMFA